MFRPALLAACAILCAAAANPERAPVLVELFTSEGCSSCPPADALLATLDPRAVVLSEHVDYWDRLGWKDRFSSHDYTARQENYARDFRLDSPYTPEMVVDGAVEFVGSDARRAAEAIAQAAARPKAQIRFTRASAGVRVEISAAPDSADVFLAVADNTAASQVAAGENKGHQLHHVAVVRSLRKLGSVKKGGSFAAGVPPPGPAQRLVVFCQQSGQGKVLGAAIE